MPVIRSDRAPAKMANHDIDATGHGSNVFLVDSTSAYKANFVLFNMFPQARKQLEAVGVFGIPDLESKNISRKPLATIEPELVSILLSTMVYARLRMIGPDYHLQVYKVVLPTVKDRQVRRYLKKMPFEVAASLMYHYGHLTVDFVNRYAVRYDSDWKPSREYATSIYRRGSNMAPATVLPYFYKFGCRFISA